jgi:hypothetical protein
MAFDTNAGLDFLRRRGVTVRSQNPGYISRIVGNIQRQEAAGLPLNRQAARGHVRTPEHPGRRRPIIPDSPSDYSRRPSRYGVMTRPLEPTLRTPLNIRRPAVHSRDITMTEDRIEAADNALIVTTSQQSRAMTELRQHRAGTGTLDRAGRRRIIPSSAARPGIHWRVRIDIYDCSSRQWLQLFTNRGGWHKPAQGIGVDYLLHELTDTEMSLEEFLIRAALDSYNPSAPLTHICYYILHFIPSEKNYWQSRTA